MVAIYPFGAVVDYSSSVTSISVSNIIAKLEHSPRLPFPKRLSCGKLVVVIINDVVERLHARLWLTIREDLSVCRS